LNEPKSLNQSPGGTSGFASIQASQFVETFKINFYGLACGQGDVAGRPPVDYPSAQSGALTAKNDPAQLIAKTTCCCRITLMAKALSKLKKFPLFPLICLDSIFDKFSQYPVCAKLAHLRQSAYLSRELGWQADALAHGFLCDPHSKIRSFMNA